jgi:hypothetical protein
VRLLVDQHYLVPSLAHRDCGRQANQACSDNRHISFQDIVAHLPKLILLTR